VHAEAMEWVRRLADPRPLVGLDIGGRDINGSCRRLFPATSWTVLDVAPGDGVTIVADAASWAPDRGYDLILCTEVFEHAEHWAGICSTAYAACKPGGTFIATMAGPGRDVHSGHDGGPNLYPGEWYGNVDPQQLLDVLDACGWSDIVVDQLGPDVRATARR
jgi:hypothetical protein